MIGILDEELQKGILIKPTYNGGNRHKIIVKTIKPSDFSKKVGSTKKRKSIFTSDEQKKLYRKLHKEYKKIRFLLSYKDELCLNRYVEKLDCSEEDVVEARKKEIEGIVFKWQKQIQDQFYNTIKFPTLMRSLPDSYRYDNIRVPYSYLDVETKIPVFDVNEPKFVTWKDIYNNHNNDLYYLYQNNDPSGWYQYSIKQAEQINQTREYSYNMKLKEFTMVKDKWDSRKARYDIFMLFMKRDLNTIMNLLLDLPDCFMKEALIYHQELIKTRKMSNLKSLKKNNGKKTNFKSKRSDFINDLHEYGLPEIDEYGNTERKSRSTESFSLNRDTVDAAMEYRGQ